MRQTYGTITPQNLEGFCGDPGFSHRAGQKMCFLLGLLFSLFGNVWSRLSDSNRPPDAYKATALPNELRRLNYMDFMYLLRRQTLPFP